MDGEIIELAFCHPKGSDGFKGEIIINYIRLISS